MKYEAPKRPKKIEYYKSESYIRDLARNNKNLNIPFKRPEVVECPTWVDRKIKNEPKLSYIDAINVELNVVGDTVKVNLHCGINELYNSYYTQGKTPSHKRIISTYREYGFSEEYINRLKKNILKTKQICDSFDMIKAFGATKSTKQAKKLEPEPEPAPEHNESDEEMSDIEDDAIPEEDGAFDVDEMNDDVEDEDEGYFSDDA